MRIFIVCLILGICSTGQLAGQVFKGQAFVGFSAAQLEGDNLAGFDKFGLHAGVQVLYSVTEKTSVGVELLYNQKGSREGIFSSNPERSTQLQYFEIPLIAQIEDWYNEEDGYYRIQGHVGLTYGYLFNAESDNALFSEGISQFNTSDIGFLCGAGFRINKRIEIVARYQRSFNQVYKSEDLITGGLLNYSWVLRTGILF